MHLIFYTCNLYMYHGDGQHDYHKKEGYVFVTDEVVEADNVEYKVHQYVKNKVSPWEVQDLNIEFVPTIK